MEGTEMNSFIEELVKKAGIDEDPTDVYVATGDELEQFARYIISECQKSFWEEACYVSDLAYLDYAKKHDTIKGHLMKEKFLP